MTGQLSMRSNDSVSRASWAPPSLVPVSGAVPRLRSPLMRSFAQLATSLSRSKPSGAIAGPMRFESSPISRPEPEIPAQTSSSIDNTVANFGHAPSPAASMEHPPGFVASTPPDMPSLSAMWSLGESQPPTPLPLPLLTLDIGAYSLPTQRLLADLSTSIAKNTTTALSAAAFPMSSDRISECPSDCVVPPLLLSASHASCPLSVPLVGLSARKKRRKLERGAHIKSVIAVAKMMTVETNREGEVLHDFPGHRGTFLLRHIPNTPSRLTHTLSTTGFGVIVERAPHFGWAVKADRHFPKNSYITQYEGVFMTREESMTQTSTGVERTHFFGISTKLVIDGLRVPVLGRGAASFANHSSSPNAYYYKLGSDVFIRSTMDINRGQWITVSYGCRFLRTTGKNIHESIK